jgi:hypothetical protein
MYKEAFDEGLLQNEEEGVGLPVEQFYLAAANDIPEILAPYITVFVRAQEYEHLCKKLKAFCLLIENTLQTTLFNFSEEVPPYEIYLVNLFRKNATLYTEDSFYPDVKPSYPNESCLLQSNHL